MSFDLSRGRVEIETQEVEHLEERPDLRGSDGAPLMRTHDLADHLRVVHRLARNEPGCREAMREVRAVARCSCAVEQPSEVSQ